MFIRYFNMQFSKNRHRFYSAWLSDQSSGNRNLFIFSAISSPVRRLCKPLRLLLVFLKVIFLIIWQPPAFPYRLQYSIIGRLRLNHRVRYGNGCVPQAHHHRKFVRFDLWKLNNVRCQSVDLSDIQALGLVYVSLERRWSSRTFRYGYLVTTSPQSSTLP